MKQFGACLPKSFYLLTLAHVRLYWVFRAYERVFLLDRQWDGFENWPLYKVESDQKVGTAAVFFFFLNCKKPNSPAESEITAWGRCLCWSVLKMRFKNL